MSTMTNTGGQQQATLLTKPFVIVTASALVFFIYIGMVTLLFVTLSLWMGWPDLGNWQNTILPVVLGPAILVVGYGLLVHFGNKRIDKEIADDEENN